MSNVIPPLLSSSPPPMVGVLDEEEDDEFGDFAVATNLSYGCDALSLPSSPEKSPKKSTNQSIPNHCHNVDTNNSEIMNINASKSVEKDFQDKRKTSVSNTYDSERITSDSEIGVGQENNTEANVNNLLYNNRKIKPKTDNKYSNFQYFPDIPPDIVPENGEDDEFGDIGSDFVEEFDEFRGFESSRNNGDVTGSGKHVIPDEMVNPTVGCTTDPEPNLKLTEQALNDCKPNGETPHTEDKNSKKDELSSVAAELPVSTNSCNSEMIVDSRDNFEVSGESKSDGITSNQEEYLEKTIDNFENLVIDVEESANKENSAHLPLTKISDEIDSNNEESSSLKEDEEDSFKDAVISESENMETAACPFTVEQPPADEASTEDEDDFGDFENHSFEPSNKSEPLQLTDVTSVKTGRENLDKSDVVFPPNDSTEDDFGDFETPVPDLQLQWESDPFSNTANANLENSFGDFDNQVFEPSPQLKEQDGFGTFSDFSSAGEDHVESKLKVLTDKKDDDEFGDFNDYSAQPHSSQQSDSGEMVEGTQQLQRILSVDIELIPQKAQAIILEMFPLIKQSTGDYFEEDFTSSNPIFAELKDVTDTCALLYQWGKSNSQGSLLKALNIDTRNILYGPRWNESMPRYAATLGYTPLEPVKSEAVASSSSEAPAVVFPSSQIPSIESVQQTEIPSAQFDWVGSGLTNPLENSPASTMLLDLEQLVASLDIQFSSTLTPKSPNSPSPVNDIDDWEFWLRLTPKKTIEKRDSQLKDFNTSHTDLIKSTQEIETKTTQEIEVIPTDFEFSSVLQPEVSTVLRAQSDNGSVKSLQLNEVQPEEATNKVESDNADLDDFTSFQSSSRPEENTNFSSWNFSTVPLRETHISNTQDDVSRAKPTKSVLNFDEPGWLKPTIVTPDLPRKTSVIEELHEDEDEFSDFQTSKPSANSDSVPIQLKLESNESYLKADACVNANTLTDADGDDEDEFTDFQSTLPTNTFNPTIKPTPIPQEPLQPLTILEPLKPSISQLLQPTASTAINWPDPGITDDDLMGIVLNYKPKLLNNDSEVDVQLDPKRKSESVDAPSCNSVNTQEPSKSLDDDDWSDFVSNQGPSTLSTIHGAQPVLKTTSQLKQPSRTSTPELPLSVPQLNQIQPPRKSVPIITQQGLLQTKLPANVPIEPLVQPSVQQTKMYPQTSHLQNGFQPSLISNQFAAQFGQGFGCRNIQQNRAPQDIELPKPTKQVVHNPHYLLSPQISKPSPTPIPSSVTEEFDDEWTDFVSSQPALPTVANGLHGHPPPKLNLDWNRPPQFTSWSTNVTPNIITNPVSFDSFQSYNSPAQTDLLKSRAGNRKNPNVVVQPKRNTIPSISSVPDLEFIAPKNRTWKK